VPKDWNAWENLIVAGKETLTPRMTNCPVRLPLPIALHQGSIYENQRELKNRFFEDPPAKRAAT
jgi:phytanoyl-CoA hydroxylase